MQSPTEVRRERVSTDGIYAPWKYGSLSTSLQGQSFLRSGGSGMDSEEGLGCEEFLCPKLEISFCKDFNCCGVLLHDLHDLCRHYEEAHVCLEDEKLLVTPGARFTNTALSCRQGWDKTRPDLYENYGTEMDLDQEFGFDHLFLQLSESEKQLQSMAPLSISTRDFLLSSSNMSTPSSSMPSTPTFDSSQEFLVVDMDDTETVVMNGSSLLAEEWVKQQMKKQRQHGVSLSDTESRSTIDSPGSNFVVVDKPYKCPVLGCDKAYKNQNGLKYHKLHGHCTASVMFQDAAVPIAFSNEVVSMSPKGNPVVENKPYKCELCNKRYKNLNGLKYHKAHSHRQISMAQVQREVLMQGW